MDFYFYPQMDFKCPSWPDKRGKTKRTKTKPNQMEKSSQLTAEMIQGKFEKLA